MNRSKPPLERSWSRTKSTRSFRFLRINTALASNSVSHAFPYDLVVATRFPNRPVCDASEQLLETSRESVIVWCASKHNTRTIICRNDRGPGASERKHHGRAVGQPFSLDGGTKIETGETRRPPRSRASPIVIPSRRPVPGGLPENRSIAPAS